MADSPKQYSRVGVFRGAITDKDGNVDAGYLAMFWSLVGWSINNGVILTLGSIAINKLAQNADAGQLIQNIGIALGANATGFGAVCGAIGLFRAGDKDKYNDLRYPRDPALRERDGDRLQGDGVEGRSQPISGS